MLAAVAQFWALDAQSLWYDEGFSVWLSVQPAGEIIERTAADIHPPFYYLLLHGWIGLVGDSEWALRFLSALFAVLTVPLLWQFGRRLLRQERAGDMVAFLAAISPLWLWYGREVRMYALLLALLAAAALLLLKTLRGQWWAALLLAILLTVGVYTHFYVWFVVVAWALAAAVTWLRKPQLSSLLPILSAFTIPVVAYLPWLAVTLRRLDEDRSYWEGLLGAGEVAGQTLGSWMVGHTMVEAVALPLGWVGGGLALLGCAVLFWRARRPDPAEGLLWRASGTPRLPLVNGLLLLLWLVLPFVGLYLLSWNRPKFHPRYLIFAAPAFLLLLAAFVTWCWTRRWAGKLVGSLVFAGVVGVFLVADWNLFNDPAFAKADWRGVATYLKENRQVEEPLLLVSGHAFPVFHYYYRERENVFYLPNEPTLDTTAVLGLTAGKQVAADIEGARDVWVVEWQDEVVDPEEVVPALLNALGASAEQAAQFMEVSLTHWSLPESPELDAVLEPDYLVNARFGEKLTLLGWDEPAEASAVDEGLFLRLYWAAQQPLEGDYKVRLSVVDEEGFVYGGWDQRPTSYLYPTFRWQAGEPRLASVRVPLQPGTPPGKYHVKLSVYEDGESGNLDLLDGAGAPQGQELLLGPVTLAPSTTGWFAAGLPNTASEIDRTLLGSLELLAVQFSQSGGLEAGQRFPCRLWWRTHGPVPGARLHVGWENGSGIVESNSQLLGGDEWSGEHWRAGELLMTPLTVRVPRELEAGTAQLVVWVSDATGRESERVPLMTEEIAAPQRTFDAPRVEVPQAAAFGETIRLLGYALDSEQLRPEEPATLTLYWESAGEMDVSYTTFVHLLTKDGAIVPGAGEDKLPLNGARPTDSWVKGGVCGS
jgi:4-amino-4-deoxy-L-arabinose transferase-like glycosyltransferase